MDNLLARRVLIVANPNSGSRSRTDLINALCMDLSACGLVSEACTSLEELPARIAALHASGSLAAVVAAGGDGTASAVATRCAPDIPIAILPLGTENLLAKYLGLTHDTKRLATAIQQQRTRCIDCGEANGKLFLVMVGIGFDAQVVYEMSLQRKGHIQHWSYTLPILRSVWQYRFPECTITAQVAESTSRTLEPAAVSPSIERQLPPPLRDVTKPEVWKARWVFVANVPRYAAGLPIADWAASDDGLLDICSFRDGGLLRSLSYLVYLYWNRHRQLNDFRTCTATSLRITSEQPVAYQLDGDYGGTLPVDIRILPQRLKLIVA